MPSKHAVRVKDPLKQTVVLTHETLTRHIYRRHPKLNHQYRAIVQTIRKPDLIAKSKKDQKSLLYFRRVRTPLLLMVVATPVNNHLIVRTSFYVLNTSKGDPILWQRTTHST